MSSKGSKNSAGDRNAGRESVWDYPRPPCVQRSSEHVEVWFAGQRIADSTNAIRVLETSHPPTYYIPASDVAMDHLAVSTHRSVCEFKGKARYYDIAVRNHTVRNAVWDYPNPRAGYEILENHLCFYPGKMDRCLVDGEEVQRQEGEFYGGWITSRITGPFKGGPGTRGW